jgi:hypothetical protein
MTTREIAHEIKVVHLKDQTAVTSATQTTSTLDTIGYEAAMIVWDISVWAGAGSTWTPSLQESDTDFSGAAVPDVNQEWFLNGVSVGYGAANAPVVSDANTDQCTIGVSYVAGTKRYLQGVLTLVSSPTTMIAVPLGILARKRELGVKAYSNWSA